MNFELLSMTVSDAAVCKGDVLVVLVPKAFKPGKGVVPDLIAAALKSGDMETKTGKLLPLYQVPGVACKRLILVGCDDGNPHQIRKAVATAVAAVKSTNSRNIVVCLASSADEGAVRMAVMASAEASYVYTTTKSKPEPRVLSQVTIGVADPAPLQSAFDRVVAAVKGVEFAKEWANRPGNYATPTMLADAAKSLAKAPQVQCEVLGPKQVAKLGMGAFMAVAAGSHEELRFIVLRYNGGPKGEAPMVLVGKGISFDSGGISIKPSPEMDEMKYDMCGAASVLGVFRALGELKLPMNVVGLIPSCENLPDGKAVKPGDVVTSMSGQTIEILNTDAEGRLVLCDALTYAERFEPKAVVDIATLTGACVIALGGVRSGMFSSTDALADNLLAAGESAQDPCWRMPLDDDYADGLKTNFADVANVGGRPAGAITAAKFLQRFTEKYPWAHLDIAGTAWKGGAAKGATGRPVPLLLEFLWASCGQGPVATPKAPARARARRKA